MWSVLWGLVKGCVPKTRLAAPAPNVRVHPDEKVVTVARLRPSEVAVAQGLLESAGIPSVLQPAGPGPRQPAKPIRLQVRKADAEIATALLREVRG